MVEVGVDAEAGFPKILPPKGLPAGAAVVAAAGVVVSVGLAGRLKSPPPVAVVIPKNRCEALQIAARSNSFTCGCSRLAEDCG